MQQTQPGVTTKVITKRSFPVYKPKSLVEVLISIIFILSLFIVLGGFIGAGVWLQTFKAFTKEHSVGTLYVGEKIIKDGKPTITVRYVPKEDVTGLYSVFSIDQKTKDKEVYSELTGDEVFIESDFIRWSDWMTLINFQPMYKVNRIKSGFKNSEDYKKYYVSVLDINGGPDWFAQKIDANSSRFSWLAQSSFISSAGKYSQSQPRVYNVIATEDALVLEEIK